MNRHKNARTTPYGRALMVQRVRELGWSAAQQRARLSVRTVRKWPPATRRGRGLLDAPRDRRGRGWPPVGRP